MKKLDFIIIAVLLVCAGGLYFSGLLRPGDEGAYAVVYVDGEEVKRYDLSQNTEDLSLIHIFIKTPPLFIYGLYLIL